MEYGKPEKAIVVKGLKKEFEVKRKNPVTENRERVLIHAVDNISFNINKGEFVGLIGPNGAGKTTTMKCLTGLLKPNDGSVEVLGFKPYKRDYRYLEKISFVMGQRSQLWWELPVVDSFLLNKEIYRIEDDAYKRRLKKLVDFLEIGDILNTQVMKLSLGQRMKCELASALLHKPEVVFLDEPTIGLDVVMQKKLREFLKEYNKTINSTILLTSHYMEDVKDLCKRVIVIDQGEILFDGRVSDLVKMYVNYKVIYFEFSNFVNREDISSFGELEYFDGKRGKIHVKREDVTKVASKLLKSFPIEDIDIEEVSLEDVVRTIFNS
jgi:ABC-2 type transport system ATP-binding protein